MKYTDDKYTITSKIVHWVVAFVVIFMLATGYFIRSLPINVEHVAIDMHKSLGLFIFFVMFIRLLWILDKGKPSYPPSCHRLEIFVANTVHILLYLSVFAMTIIGICMAFASDTLSPYIGFLHIPNPGIPPSVELQIILFKYHQIIAYVLIGLIGMHVMGVIKHQLINKENILKRML